MNKDLKLTNGRKINKGIFQYLDARGLNVHQMRFTIKNYARHIGMRVPDTHILEWYDDIEAIIADDFDSFKKYVKKNVPSTVRVTGYTRERCSWEESNMNGDFAYNGSSKDF